MGLASGSTILSEWHIQLEIAAASDGSPCDYTDVSIAPRGWHLGGCLVLSRMSGLPLSWPSCLLGLMSCPSSSLGVICHGSQTKEEHGGI